MRRGNSGLGIVYLTRNMEAYRAAYYQQDIVSHIKKKEQVFFYGPGFPSFNSSDSIDNVLEKAPFRVDCIITGHSWLLESGTPSVESLKLVQTDVPKFGILNKEYLNVEKKLEYFSLNGFTKIFTHHQRLSDLTTTKSSGYEHIPFGFDEAKLSRRNSAVRNIDLMFTGVLQNLSNENIQSDLRVRVMRKLFLCIADLPVMKKPAFSNSNIFWKALPRQKPRDGKLRRYALLKKMFSKYGYQHLNERVYFDLLSQSKLVLCTESPLGLVSPRVFEAMASGAVVFCENSQAFSCFPDDCVLKFDRDLSDFESKYFWALNQDASLAQIADKGRTLALKEYRWGVIVDKLMVAIKKSLSSEKRLS